MNISYQFYMKHPNPLKITSQLRFDFGRGCLELMFLYLSNPTLQLQVSLQITPSTER